MALAPHVKDEDAKKRFKAGKYKSKPDGDSLKRAEAAKKESK